MDNAKNKQRFLGINTPREILYKLWQERKEILFLSLPIIGIAIFLQVFTAQFTTNLPNTTEGIADAIVDRIPTKVGYFLRPYFIYGYIAIIAAGFLYGFFFDVEDVPRLMFIFAVIVIIRTIFICLTHLGMPKDFVPVTFPGPTQHMKADNDLFFSGHTAIPIVVGLVYQKKKLLFGIFVFAGLSLGFTALAMHRHYSIDVLAAPFIAYGVYRAANAFYVWMRPLLFKKEARTAAT